MKIQVYRRLALLAPVVRTPLAHVLSPVCVNVPDDRRCFHCEHRAPIIWGKSAHLAGCLVTNPLPNAAPIPIEGGKKPCEIYEVRT